MTPPPPPPPPNALEAISITTRLPSFWQDMPRMWFAQFEAIIGPQHQSDRVKYELVVAKLGKEEIGFVADIIDNPPEQDKFGTIKRRLLAVFQESPETQFNKLIKEMDLGQQRPTQLLMRMRELAKSTGTGDGALKNLWISRMPAYVRAILAGSKDEPVDKLAILADNIVTNLKSGEVASVHTESTSSASLDINTELMTQIRNMSLEIKSLRGEVNEIRGRRVYRGRRAFRGRSRSRSFSRGRKPLRTPQSPDWICRFHYRYGNEAARCESPCNWKPAGKEN